MVGALREFLAKVTAFGETNSVEVVQTKIQRKLVSQFMTPLWQANNHAPQLVQLVWMRTHLHILPCVETLPRTQNAHSLGSSAWVYKGSNVRLRFSGEFV